MKRLVPLALVCLLALLPVPAAPDDEGPVIADIIVEGGVTLTADTVYYYLGLEPGDVLDRKAVDEGFQRLWDSGLFENLRIDIEDLPSGEVNLYVVVDERPFVSSVVFEGNKKLTTSTLKDKLDEKGIELPRNVPLKMASLSQIETAILQVYASEGYRSAQVSHRIEDAGQKAKRVVYTINEGGKVKIGKIDFVGNQVFSDRRLRGSLKKTKELSWYRFMGDKIIFSEENWDEDRENLRKYYLNHGYKDVKIGQPEITLVAKHPNAETLKKKKYRVEIKIPVEEGEPYKLGDITIKGVTVFKVEPMQKAFDVKPGKRYEFKAIDDGMEQIRDLYQNTGYIYAYVNQVLTDREGADHVVDVTIDVFEGDRYFLGRVEFVGNRVTRDKVLRREFRVAEGGVMSMGGVKSSVYKVNALGYFKLEDDPLEFSFDEEKKRVNIDVKGTEVGRNDIQFGAGYSELDGFFGQLVFNTRNFLGRGETLGVSLQSGRRTDYYTLSFTEPYLFDRRILLGGSLYRTNLSYTDIQQPFTQERTGGALTLGLGVAAFSSVSALISLEDVSSSYAVSRNGVPGDQTGGHVRPVEPPGLEPVVRDLSYESYSGKTASITPGFAYDSRDDPFDPNRGTRFTVRPRFAGGPLGGDFDYIRPEVSFSLFKQLSKRSVVAVRLEGGQFFVYNESQIPIYERYRLGGDRSIRGLRSYSLLPRTPTGGYFYSAGGSALGGDRYWIGNLEYHFRLGGPVKLVFFTDIGNTYFETQGWNLSSYRQTAGAELRIFLPIFQAPIRFIYGKALSDVFQDEKGDGFEFSIGTTF